MRSELCLLATLWLLGLGGCRQLLDPEPSAMAPLQSTIRIQHPNSNYITDFNLRLYRRTASFEYSDLGDLALTQIGFESRRQFEVPTPGIYTLWVRPQGTRNADFTLYDLNLPADLDLTAPYDSVRGSVTFPPAFDWSWASTSRLSLYYRSHAPPDPIGSFAKRLLIDLEPDGSYDAWLPPGEYDRELELWSPDAEFELFVDRVEYPQAAQTALAIALLPIDLHFQLHGSPVDTLQLQLVANDVYLSSAEDFHCDLPIDVHGSAARVWLPPGLQMLRISPLDHSFFPRQLTLRVSEYATISVELARYRVQLLCRDAQGAPLAGQALELRVDESSPVVLLTDLAGSAEISAMPGLLKVELNDVDYPDVDISGDTAIELVWP